MVPGGSYQMPGGGKLKICPGGLIIVLRRVLGIAKLALPTNDKIITIIIIVIILQPPIQKLNAKM